MKAKKIIAAACGVCMLFTVAACGGRGGETGGGGTTPTDTQTYSSYEQYTGGTHIYNYTETGRYIVSGGTSEYTIVYPAGVSGDIVTATTELSNWIENATGVDIGITTDEGLSYTSSSKYISLGDTAVAAAAEVALDEDVDVGFSGFQIKTKGESVFVLGETGSGVLFGTYELLYRLIGFVTYSGDEIYYESKTQVPLYDFDITDIPDFEYRVTAYGLSTYNAALDTEALDLFVTDVNTVDNIMNNVLPKTMNVTLNTGVTIPANVWWIDRGEGQLYGYIQSDYANVKQLSVSAEYGYTVRFDYDESAVAVTGIKLDGQAYTPGTEIEAGRHTVSFTITVLEGCELNDVYYYEISQFPLEDGGSDYSVTINNGGCIIIDAGETEYTVTYYDGEEKLFTSTYTVSGSEEAKTYEKEGYTFDGWYLDAGLTQKFTGFDRDNPTDLTLYAKTTQNATGGGDDGGRGGCSGTVTAVSLAVGLPVLAGACVCLVLARKKRS